MKVIKPLEGLQQLYTAGDLALFLRILFFAMVVPILLRFKLSRVGALLTPQKIPPTPDVMQVQKIVHYVDAVLQKGKPLVSPGCLTRGLTLYTFLRRAGVDVTLCFGVGKLEGEIVGHCWLVKEGKPFLEAQDPRPLFTPVYRFPTGSHSSASYS